MLRRWLITLLAFAIPFAIYWAYAAWQRRKGVRDPWPTAVLFLAGAVLAAETLVVAVLQEPRVQGGRYVPAHLQDGRIVPPQTLPEPPGPEEK